MKRFAARFFWIIVFFCLIYDVYLVLWMVFGWFSNLFEGVNDTVRAASITAFVTVVTFLVGKYLEQSRERRARINSEKIVVYRRFFDFYFDILSYEKLNGKPKPQKQMMQELLEFQKDVLFWAPDSVLKEFMKFKGAFQDFSSSNPDISKSLADTIAIVAGLLAAMRKDIGYSFTKFSPTDLATLQLTRDAETAKIFEHLSSRKY